MPQRLEAEEVRKRMDRDDGALLVCAYEDAEKCRRIGVGGSVPYSELKTRLDTIPKSKELVFFCD